MNIIRIRVIRTIRIKILTGQDIGTYLVAENKSLRSRKRWIADQLKPAGKIIIDSGAAKALSKGGASLLAVGVFSVSGEFDRGDLVECCDDTGAVVAQGLVNYSSKDIGKLKGLNSDSYSSHIDHVYENELIHCDNLVLI